MSAFFSFSHPAALQLNSEFVKVPAKPPATPRHQHFQRLLFTMWTPELQIAELERRQALRPFKPRDGKVDRKGSSTNHQDDFSPNSTKDDEIAKNKTKNPTAHPAAPITLLQFMAGYPQDPAPAP
ncbi:hypothetical protein MDA_GLEAN10004293 [Myotis davidii]|uniref:Uncharacterized protein n=1 Tax=Myotis davidii TaxID=225400 RepID=L5LIJ9_MYODS|nr:hypothetical protein MDA_GLEAN10004293 [Myotis davidii]